jgi:hypothetical protein
MCLCVWKVIIDGDNDSRLFVKQSIRYQSTVFSKCASCLLHRAAFSKKGHLQRSVSMETVCLCMCLVAGPVLSEFLVA